jgi:hypothetical protein
VAKKKTEARRWPYVHCPEGGFLRAADLLGTVVFRAARADAPNLDLIIARAIEAATCPFWTEIPPEACQRAIEAHRKAEAGDWPGAAEELRLIPRRKEDGVA